jgi:hypothetical protein
MYVRKNTRVTDSYKKLVLGFVIVTVILVAIILYFSASKAIVKITPRVTAVETDFVADVVTDGGAVEGALQGLLFETEVEGTIAGDATGAKALEGSSIGKVFLINDRPESQTLVQRTRLLTSDGVLLRLSNQVNIPAGGELEVGVYADDPSAFEELVPTSFTIPGLHESMQKLVYAESRVTLKSEGDTIKVVKAIDIARTKDELTEELYNKAIAEFGQQLPNQDFTTIVVSKSVMSESVSAVVDDERDTFTTDMKIKATLIALDQNKIIELAGERLRSVVPSTQELVNLNLNNFSYKVQNYDDVDKTANVKVHLEGNAVVRADHEIFEKDKLVGLSPKGLELYLANFDEVESVEVELSPFWVKKVPKLRDHIVITVISPSE